MRDPRTLRERAGVDGDPSRDQYFLEDDRVLDRMVDYAVDAEWQLAHVLEIGPGTGALTARLLGAADRVTAIERDRRLVDFLREEFAPERDEGVLTVVHGDALDVALPAFSACIANLPYGISSELIFRLLPEGHPILVMVQREFGERMAAAPDTADYGRLSVTTQHYGAVEIRETVPPTAFEPSPPVESAIVAVLPREPPYTLRNEDRFFDVVRGLFTQRRKTVRNGIRNTGHITGIADPETVIEALPPDLLQQRPGALAPDAFARIANVAMEVERA